MNLHDWIDELCDVLEIEAEVDEGLVADLVRTAHENVEPAAGPVTAYLLGVAAGEGAAPDDVEALAAKAQQLAEGWDRPAGARDPDDPDDAAAGVPDDAEVARVDHTADQLEDA